MASVFAFRYQRRFGNGKVSFTLIDLDGDGKRDLIIDSYVGGTGLFSYTGVLKRGDSALSR
ncbi:hypothetical protein CSC18_0014 [Klebsiella aerogenes]|nr:hypothetical protein CSC18_0014 [Klebsiella aerogenes]